MLRLHDIKPGLVDSDIKLFLKTRLTEITKNQSICDFAEDWPSSQDVDALCKKAAGFFIYASTVVKFVASQYDPPDERLALIISLPQDTSHEGKAGIDMLYTQVLEQAFHNRDANFYLQFRLVVGTALLIFNPLSIKALSGLLGDCSTEFRISSILRALHSLLCIPDSTENPVQFFHKSFPDFLMDPGRCTDTRFFVDPPVYHRKILLACLNLMKGSLRKNICNLDNITPLNNIEDLPARKAACIRDALGYACCFWTTHLARTATSSLDVEVQNKISDFFTTCLPFWIEALSLMGKLDVGLYALNDIKQWYLLVSWMW